MIRFGEADCRSMGRVSRGVRGISLTDAEKIVGMELIGENIDLLSVNQDGFGKRTNSNEYRAQSRGGKGIMAMKLTSRTGDIVQIKPVTDKDDLMIITNRGQVIRLKVKEISIMGRTTQGVRLINVKEGRKSRFHREVFQ